MRWSCQTGNKKAWDFSWSPIRKVHWKSIWKLELVAGFKYRKTMAKSQNSWDSLLDYSRESHFCRLSISIVSHLQTNGQPICVYIYTHIDIQIIAHTLLDYVYRYIQYTHHISHSPLIKTHSRNMVSHHFADETG